MTYIRWLSAQIVPITKITKNEYRYSNEMCLRLRSGTSGGDQWRWLSVPSTSLRHQCRWLSVAETTANTMTLRCRCAFDFAQAPVAVTNGGD
jgi:hypothetical protein